MDSSKQPEALYGSVQKFIFRVTSLYTFFAFSKKKKKHDNMDMEADLKKKTQNICLQKQHLLHNDTVDRETTNKAQKSTQMR